MEFMFKHSVIKDVIFVRRKKFTDFRGNLVKEFEALPFNKYFSTDFKEEYVSISKKGVLRGLHFQREPKPQGKFVSVVNGSIFDVAVDLRPSSITYLKHVAYYLYGETADALWIPEGFAHGFLSLEDNTIVINRSSNEYDAELEGGLKWDDPKLAIQWPIKEPILSEKDKLWKYL